VSSRPLRFPLSLHLGTLAVGLGCFPLDCETHLPQSDCPAQAGGIRSLVGLGNLTAPKSIQCSTSASHARTLALKLFRGEQAISRLLGISPLPTAHPMLLQQQPVRASNALYRAFTLAMGSSPGFVSNRCHFTPCSDSLSLRLRLCLP